MKKNIIVILSAIFTIMILNSPINVKAQTNNSYYLNYSGEDFENFKNFIYLDDNIEIYKNFCSNYFTDYVLLIEMPTNLNYPENTMIKCVDVSEQNTFYLRYYASGYWSGLRTKDSSSIKYRSASLKTDYSIKESTISAELNTDNLFSFTYAENSFYHQFYKTFTTTPVYSSAPIYIDNMNTQAGKLYINDTYIDNGEKINFYYNLNEKSISFTPEYYPNSNDLKFLNISYSGYPESYVQNVCYYRSSKSSEWISTSCSAGVNLAFSQDYANSDSITGDKDSIFYEAKMVENGEIVAYNIFSYGDNAYSYSDIFYINQNVDYPNSLEFIYHIDNTRLPSAYVMPVCYYMTSQKEEWVETTCSSIEFTEPINGVTYYAKIEYNGAIQDYVYYEYKYNPMLPEEETNGDIDVSLMLSYVDKLIGKLPIIGDIYNFFTFFISYTPPEYEEGYSPLPPIDFDFMGVSVYVPINWDLFLEYRPLIHTLIKLSFITHFILKLWNQVNRFLEKGL